jgi:NAD(P)-dependent dehydrogenase (short-subunit alcohol dehydrogenase family)
MSACLTGLDDKVAVVTGAGRMRSIGRTAAVELARAGCDVVVTGTGRSPDRYPDDEKAAGWRDIESVADEIRSLGRRALAAVSDVTDLDAITALADQVTDEFGRVDIVVNNAGAAKGDDRVGVVDLDPELMRTVIDVNLVGTFLMSKVFGQRLIKQGNGGSIINISSIVGKAFPPNSSAYAASKAGVQALTACMAREVAEHGIRVNALCPGIIDTSRLDDVGRRRGVAVDREDIHTTGSRRHDQRRRWTHRVSVLGSRRMGDRAELEHRRRFDRPTLMRTGIEPQ